jgi:hypothetical protein
MAASKVLHPYNTQSDPVNIHSHKQSYVRLSAVCPSLRCPTTLKLRCQLFQVIEYASADAPQQMLYNKRTQYASIAVGSRIGVGESHGVWLIML